MAKAEKTTKKKSKGKMTLYIILTVISMFFLKTTTIFVIIGMFPAVVAYYADLSKKMLYFRSLAACNLAGVLPFAGDMISRNNTLSGFISIATDPMTWLVILGASGGGVLLAIVCPMIAHSFIDLTQQNRIISIELRQRRIVEEWGTEVQRDNKQL
jgi:hypothetical protein